MLRLLAIFLTCVVATVSPRTTAAQPAGRDTAPSSLVPLRAQNPIIDNVARLDPDGLRNLLSKLAFLATNHGAPARTGAPPTAGEAAQIAANPAFGQAYKSDPGGTLVLLRSTNEELRKARLGADQGQPRRLALVVGDSGDAVWGRLENAKNDAELIARTLKTLGFDLITGGAVIDPDRRHLQQAIVDFGHSIGSQTVALFYFAGHGIQSGGHNYLVPLGAPFPRSEDEYEKNLVEVDDPVLSKMQQAGGRLNIVVLDACRDHPPLPAFMTASRGGSQFAQGLTAVTPPPGMNGTVILYSTAPNNIALDRVNPGDADSPFAAAFATAVVRPGADLRDAFDEIQDAVKSATRGRQQPWISYSAVGKFSFSDRPGVQEASSRIPMPTLPTPVEDPRKELAGLGVTWTPANFHSAIREKDYRAVELFLRGGMKMDIRGAGYTEFSLFVEMNYDQKIAEMIEKYGAPDPDRLCPVPLQYYRSYHFYTDTAMQSPASAQFMKKICNAPSVITNIDAGIAKLQTTAAEDRKARDAAKKAPPPNAWQREVSEGMASVMPSMRPASVGYRWEISPVTHDWHEVEDAENEAIGWQAARDFLTRGVVPPKMLPLPRR